MADERDRRSDDRHERLAAIVVEHACPSRDCRTACAFLSPAGRTPRFAAVTSEEAPLPDRVAAGGRLLVADSTSSLVGLMDRECRRGRRGYGRVWDLEAPWDPPSDLDVAYRVRVAAERDPAIYRVMVSGRDEGIYLFDHPHDAEDFFDAVRRHGDLAELSEELLHDRLSADALIGVEATR
jgi:hypothetical protein